MQGVRLQKVIAEAGLMSRRAAEEAIRKGRVTVNGRLVTEMGFQVDSERDEIRVDKKRISIVQAKYHLVFYKPRGSVTTLKDPEGRKTIFDFLPDMKKVRLYPVGRLDYDAEGLLILTNDGPLAHRLQHPSYGVPKIYEVKVKGRPDESVLERLRSGIILEEGKTAPAEVLVMRLLPGAAWLRIILHQGWNRQIKRMGEVVGHPVIKIKRVGYGPLKLGKLTPGAYRSLTPREVEHLYRLVHLSEEQFKRP
jgi:23S rRNA pseudouridine2605 synthase